MAKKASIRNRSPINTVGTRYSGSALSVPGGWGNKMGMDQARSRSAQREGMGRKMTPLGGGKLKPRS